MNLPYDQTDPQAIVDYAEGLIGKTLKQAVKDLPEKENEKHKGDLGALVEKYYFKWNPPTNNGPDFPEAGLELKTTGIKKLKSGKLVPKERLSLTMIDYDSVVHEEWDSCSLMKKCSLMLILFYMYELDLPVTDRRFIAKKLWEMPESDLEVIRRDWEKIVKKIEDGKAHELSEGDTDYLGAATKSDTSKKRRSQPNSDTPAKPRAFTLKPSYIRTLLDPAMVSDMETILEKHDRVDDFEAVALEKLHKHKGRYVDGLLEELGKDVNTDSKSYLRSLTNRMLGTRKSKVAEFVKAGIEVKTIRLSHNGTPKESMSFPYFEYMDMDSAEWDDSDFKNIVEKRFLFVVFQYGDDKRPETLHFKGAFFWNMPYKDRLEAQRVWEETVDRITHGNAENLPGSKDSRVAHVRPHGRNAADALPTPQGLHLPRKSFWLNDSYLKEQILTGFQEDET